MGEVVALADRGPHLSGSALCAQCGHTWVRVAPDTPNAQFECPACHADKAFWVHPIVRDVLHWECACGCQLYRIHQGPVAYCINCGKAHEGFGDPE